MFSNIRPFLLSIPFFAVPLLSGPLSAQTVPSPYRFIESRQEAGFFLGQANPGTGRFGYGPSGGLMIGGRYGIRLGGPFALEANLGWIPSNRDLIDPTRVEGDRVVGDVPTRIMTVDARIRFTFTGDRTWHSVAPFALVGGGGAFQTSGGDPIEDERLLPDDQFTFKSTFTGVLGGGLQWYVGDRFVLRGDVTLMMWRITSPQGFRDPERELTGVEEKEWVSGPSFSFGTSIRF